MSAASDPLYKKALLRLAADAAGAGKLPAPDASAAAANPACGDRVTMEVMLEGGQIAALAHHTQACILTQASAAILGAAAVGRTRAELAELAERVTAMLEGGPAPDAPFGDYAVFDGVAALPGRHTCVLLPLVALLEALEPGEPGRQRPQ